MSTIAQPSNKDDEKEESIHTLFPPVPWSFYYYEKEEEGASLPQLVSSRDGILWNDISHPEKIDGTILQISTHFGTKLWLYPPAPDHEMVRIEVPFPTRFFAFTRHTTLVGAPIHGVPVASWLYSCFGYILPDFLLVVKLFPKTTTTRVIEQRLLRRPCPFPL